MDWIWDVLQIGETTDQRKIKRAYAACSRKIHPEEKPQEFQVLYNAYQAALQYASFGKRVMTQEAGVPEAKQERGDTLLPGDPRICGILDEDFEELKKQWSKMEEIQYFQNYFNRQISFWMRSGEFLSETWVNYLQSERFQDIMWNQIVMETISTGVSKYFQRKQQILLFFWNLYGLDIYEKWGEDSFDEDSLRVLYRSLYSVSKEGLLQQRIKSINVFLENWNLQMTVWKTGDGFLEKWKEYLRSEGFGDIMFTSTVLEAITKGMKGRFPCHEEAALFFWDLYGFEELGEKNCEGRVLALYKVLYPSYILRLKREEYERSKDSIAKEEKRRIYKILIIVACVLVLFVALFFIMPSVFETVLLIALAITIWNIFYFAVRLIMR